MSSYVLMASSYDLDSAISSQIEGPTKLMNECREFVRSCSRILWKALKEKVECPFPVSPDLQ